MALRNIFKKNKPEKTEEGSEKIEEHPKEEAVKPQMPKRDTGISSMAYRVLKSPRITEKGTDLAKNNQYVFKVGARANKSQVKEAIEKLYKVNVLSVKTAKIPRKKKRIGMILGWRGGCKKAIVRIREGQKIEAFPK